MNRILNLIHQYFLFFVKPNRGDRLNAMTTHRHFSGASLTGNEALELGLVDGVEMVMNAFLYGELCAGCLKIPRSG